MTKCFLAGFLTETNTFCPFPTTLTDFKNCHFSKKLGSIETATYWDAPLCQFATRAAEEKWQCTHSLCATAMPAGPVTKKTYQEITDIILNDLKRSLPIDVVFLHLHGAMISETCDDCEGDLLRKIRNIVGKNTIISTLFDPHTHLTNEMIQFCDIPIWMKEYPHTDGIDRTDEAFDLIKQMLQHKITPTPAVYDCQSIGLYPTQNNVMRQFLEKIAHIERDNPAVLSISPIHGFPWGDTLFTGSKLLVITNNDKPLATELSETLGKEFKHIAQLTRIVCSPVEDALRHYRNKPDKKPTVWADYADNVGGGAPGDSTFILDVLLKNNINNFLVSSIYDPIAVKTTSKVNKGSKLQLHIGGKLNQHSGVPIKLTVIVKEYIPKMHITFAGNKMYFGNSVACYIEKLNAYIILNDSRCQTYSADCFTNFGIDPKQFDLIVVKSSEHFRHSFSSITDDIHIISTPGALNPDLETIHYKKCLLPNLMLEKT